MNTQPTQYTTLWPLVLYAFLVVAILIGMVFFSYFLGGRKQTPAKNEPFESGIVSVGSAQIRFPSHFYLIAMFFVIFDLESVFLFAWAVAFREAGWAGYIEAMVFIVILLAALAYLWAIGALDWGTSARKRLG